MPTIDAVICSLRGGGNYNGKYHTCGADSAIMIDYFASANAFTLFRALQIQ